MGRALRLMVDWDEVKKRWGKVVVGVWVGVTLDPIIPHPHRSNQNMS